MGILQNILKTINTAIDSIDFSPYQLISNKSTDVTLADNSDTLYPSQKAVKTYADTKQTALGYTAENTANKNVAGGYLGANANGKLDADQIESLLEIINYNALAQATDTTNITAYGDSTITYSSNSQAYLNSNTYISRPTLTIPATSSNVVKMIVFPLTYRCNTPWGIYSEFVITCNTNNTTNSHDVWIGLFNSLSYPPKTTTTDSVATQGLFLRRNPTLNSGKWQIVKIAGGVYAVTDTNITYQGDKTPILGKVIYNKYNETAYFYLDNVLVYTMTSVSFASNISFFPMLGVYQNTTSDAFAKTFSLISIKEGMKKYA